VGQGAIEVRMGSTTIEILSAGAVEEVVVVVV